MKRMMLIFLILSIFSCTIYVGAAPVQTYQEVIPVMTGVTLTKVQEFHSTHNLTYSYITADLSSSHLSLSLLTPEGGIDTFATVDSLANSEPQVVAAMNADFFSSYDAKRGFSLGLEIKDGKLLQSPIDPGAMATIYTNGDEVFMSYLDFHIMVVAPDWEYREVRHLNKHTSYFGDILMYTHDWNGGMSPAPGGEVVEVVVEDGCVKEFRRNQPPCEIPENGCVLVVSEGADMFFANHFKEGDPIKFDYYYTPDLSEVKEAFGGGAMLVDEGKALNSFSHVVSGNNPRSAIGIDASGTRLIMLAVNGRQSASRGVSMTELAEMMAELGCHKAVNLDGGGSTNMVASTVWAPKLHTVNTPTENRPVANAVGIIGTLEPTEIPKTIIMESDVPAVFIGQSAEISYAVYDENMLAVSKEAELFSNKGKIKDGIFTATKGGEAVIWAECGKAEAELSVYVVDEIAGIKMPQEYQLAVDESISLAFDVFDEAGHYVSVTNFEPFTIQSSDQSVVRVKGNTLTAEKEGTAMVTVSKNGVSHTAAVYVGGGSETYTESFETENMHFAAYPDTVTGAVSLSDSFAVSGSFCAKLSYDFTAEEEETRGAYLVFSTPVAIADTCDRVMVSCCSDTEFLHTVKAQLIDGDGEVQRLDFKGTVEPIAMMSLTLTIPDSVKRPVKLTRIYVSALAKEPADSGCIFLDDLSVEVPVPMKKIVVKDPVYKDKAENAAGEGETFFVGAVAAEESCWLERLTCQQAIKAGMTHDAFALLGGMRGEQGMLSGNGFEVNEQGNTLFLRLDTKEGGIRATDAKQWDLLAAALNETQAENIFIISDHAMEKASEFENRVMHDFLGGLDKNVFVIVSGEENALEIKNGVRYFTLAAAPENPLAAYRYLSFTLGATVSYRWERLW